MSDFTVPVVVVPLEAVEPAELLVEFSEPVLLVSEVTVVTVLVVVVPLFAAPTPLQAVTPSISPPVKAIIIIFFFIIYVSFLYCLIIVKVLRRPFPDD